MLLPSKNLLKLRKRT